MKRLELSTRYQIITQAELTKCERSKLVANLHDKMTQCEYEKPLKGFDLGIVPEDWFEVDVMNKGKEALREVNEKLGLAFDEQDLEYYTHLFRENPKLKRNPTSVELFDLAQSNSEHSRHWFFKGKMVLNSVEQKECLMQLIQNTQSHSNKNNRIAFSDNSR